MIRLRSNLKFLPMPPLSTNIYSGSKISIEIRHLRRFDIEAEQHKTNMIKRMMDIDSAMTSTISWRSFTSENCSLAAPRTVGFAEFRFVVRTCG